MFTSVIFMLVHDLHNPLNLITKDWKLGLGLFLLGVLLNLIFVLSEKLYTSIGAHMGLVSVKVLFRRIPILKFYPTDQLPFWIHQDLRQSLLIQLFFLTTIISLIIYNRAKLFPRRNPTK